jgi:hypothetical protein
VGLVDYRLDPGLLQGHGRARTGDAAANDQCGAGMGHDCSSSELLAVHLDLGLGLVDVDGDVVEVLDQVLDVLWLQLTQVDQYAVLAKLIVGLVERLRWD